MTVYHTICNHTISKLQRCWPLLSSTILCSQADYRDVDHFYPALFSALKQTTEMLTTFIQHYSPLSSRLQRCWPLLSSTILRSQADYRDVDHFYPALFSALKQTTEMLTTFIQHYSLLSSRLQRCWPLLSSTILRSQADYRDVDHFYPALFSALKQTTEMLTTFIQHYSPLSSRLQRCWPLLSSTILRSQADYRDVDHFYPALFSALKQTTEMLTTFIQHYSPLSSRLQRCWPLLSSTILRSQANYRDVDHFYPALFSALKQTHCALVGCHSKRVTSFSQRLLNIHPSGVVTVLFSSYMADATQEFCQLGMFCVLHTAMHPITSLHATPHT